MPDIKPTSHQSIHSTQAEPAEASKKPSEIVKEDKPPEFRPLTKEQQQSIKQSKIAENKMAESAMMAKATDCLPLCLPEDTPLKAKKGIAGAASKAAGEAYEQATSEIIKQGKPEIRMGSEDDPDVREEEPVIAFDPSVSQQSIGSDPEPVREAFKGLAWAARVAAKEATGVHDEDTDLADRMRRFPATMHTEEHAKADWKTRHPAEDHLKQHVNQHFEEDMPSLGTASVDSMGDDPSGTGPIVPEELKDGIKRLRENARKPFLPIGTGPVVELPDPNEQKKKNRVKKDEY